MTCYCFFLSFFLRSADGFSPKGDVSPASLGWAHFIHRNTISNFTLWHPPPKLKCYSNLALMFSICKGRSGISEVSLVSSSLLEILSEFQNPNLLRILLKNCFTVPFQVENPSLSRYLLCSWKPLIKLGYCAMVGRPVKTSRRVEERILEGVHRRVSTS